MATPLETRSAEITDEVMVRRLKNRERQRRYRARKRLEEDIKKSCMTQQCTWLPNEQQLCDTATALGNQEVQLPAESQSDAVIIPSSDRVHCSRKWKQDARQAHLFSNIENSPAEVLHSVEPVLECESTVKNIQTSSIRRRDWKAEARSKNKIEIGTDMPAVFCTCFSYNRTIFVLVLKYPPVQHNFSVYGVLLTWLIDVLMVYDLTKRNKEMVWRDM
ncbi:hypothetical protein J5N97_018743 [Dioscorea zingiberensis]|uniref:Uncharacterized protein n=1 Tax=Dioscorea zingiberensis TaxID=325984 RepID=A0A9D5CD85_9LILI|nr:hypothetical protein J5N97_018743 [Dioscorea zingiberensis]